MTRATLGVLPSTPVAFLQAEGGSVPAEARLNGRPEAFAVRLMSRDEPRDGLLRAGTGLGAMLRSLVERDERDEEGRKKIERVERVECSRGRFFPGRIEIPEERRGEEKDEAIKRAIAEANDMEEDTCTIWTDGSRLEGGEVGVGMAWFEGTKEDTNERTETTRRDYRTAGQRREGGGETYLGRRRTMRSGKGGWRSNGFCLGGGHGAYDAEVAALVYGLTQLHGRHEQGQTYTIFTDSIAAMRRLGGDTPGPGQDMAIRAIEIAEHLAQRDNTVTIRWTPAHRGVEGNERADSAAKDAATLPPLRGTRGRPSPAPLGRRTTERTTRQWTPDTKERAGQGRGGRGAFTVPGREARPRIRPLLRAVGKRVASRYFQLLSGHAMIAPFLKDKWGWIDEDRCWWCERGRQSRDHLFKECSTWKDEIRELWNRVGGISGRRGLRDGREPFKSRKGFGFHVRQARARPSNTTVRELLSDSRYTEAVLDFLRRTRVGEVREGVICR